MCLGSGFGCAPPLLAELIGCVWFCLRVPPGPLPLLAGGAVRGCVLGLGLERRPATPGWGVGACVCLCARPACTPPLLAGVCGVGVCAWAQVWAAPRYSWLGRWGVCVFVRMSCLYPAIPGGVVCVCVGLSFVCSPVFSWLGCWGAWPLVCAASVSRHLPGGAACGVGVCGSCRGWGLPPPLPFFSGCEGRCGTRPCRVVALRCPTLAVQVLGLVVSVPRSPLLPAAPSCFFLLFFCPSLPQRGVCRRVWGVLSSGGPLLSVWVSPVLAGWSSGVPLGGPVGAVFGAVWLGGLPASCGVGGRLRGCGPISWPPPLFWGGVCLFLPLPSLGWCTHPSAFGVVNQVAVGACVLLGLAPAPLVGWVMYTLGTVALPVGLGSGCLRPWVRGAGVSSVPPPPRCRL